MLAQLSKAAWQLTAAADEVLAAAEVVVLLQLLPGKAKAAPKRAKITALLETMV